MAIMRTRTLLAACAAAALTVALAAPAAVAATAPTPFYKSVTMITGPGVPPGGQWCVDISYVVPGLHRYFLADATNRQIDVVNTRTNRMLAPIGHGDFTGPGGCLSFDFSQEGPQGIVRTGGRLWAGNGDSRLQVFSIRTGKRLAVIDTGGKFRTDELAAAPGVVLATKPDEARPYFVLVSTNTYRVIGRYRVPGALTYEQPQWDSRTGLFYMSVPATKTRPGGEIAVFNPYTHRIVRTLPAPAGCAPGGLALNSGTRVMAVGCGNGPAVLMTTSGKVTATFPQLPGTDEVWLNARSGRWFFGSYATSGCGIVTPAGRYLGQIAAAGPGFHACGAGNDEVFVPQSGTATVPGGVAVYRAR